MLPLLDENVAPHRALDELKISAVDGMVDNIRELIDARGLGIGDSLPTERELGELFSAGRNTVREALQVLRAYGLIETRPKVGAIISSGQGEALKRLFLFHQKMTTKSFQDVQVFRKLIEAGIGETIILNASTKQIEQLHKVNETILQATTAKEAAISDYKFHEALVELAGNHTTVATYRMLRPVLSEIMELGKELKPNFELTYLAHKAIIEALLKRDRLAYAYLLSRHLEFGLQFVEGANNSADT